MDLLAQIIGMLGKQIFYQFLGKIWLYKIGVFTENSPSFTTNLYQVDVASAQNGGDGRGLDEVKIRKYGQSIFNSLKYFHVCKVGYMPPCIMHDLYQGKIFFIK